MSIEANQRNGHGPDDVERLISRHSANLYAGRTPEDFHRDFDEDSVERRKAYNEYILTLIELARDDRHALAQVRENEHKRALEKATRATARATLWIAILAAAQMAAVLAPQIIKLISNGRH